MGLILTLTKREQMTKLFYIKCDDFICDVTDRYDHAKELIKEYPQAVTLTKTDDFDDYHMVDESKMVAILMKAVQELSAKVEALENA